MSRRVVCFDLGGVMVRVNHTWEDALASAGLAPKTQGPLGSFEPFLDYQAGKIGDAGYLRALAAHLALDEDTARSVHAAILRDEVPGISETVAGLRRPGLVLGCLSNTNALHWSELVSERFPTVAGLDVRMASHEVGLSKPEPGLFRAFERSAGAQPGEVVFFDDVPEFVQAARALGWTAHRVDPDGDVPGQLRAHLVAEGLL